MQFSKELRPRVRSGEITTSVRIWKQPRVKVGGRYALPPGEIEVTSIEGLSREELTDAIARRSGFDDLARPPANRATRARRSGVPRLVRLSRMNRSNPLGSG